MEARRMEAARRFARGESQAVVARALGVTRVTACRWFQAWRAKGRAGLKGAGRPGHKPALDGPQLGQVGRALRRGPRAHGFDTDAWTLPRIARLIERLTGVRHHPGHVCRIVQKMGWSLQRPARQAGERGDAAIGRWVPPPPPRLSTGPAGSGRSSGRSRR